MEAVGVVAQNVGAVVWHLAGIVFSKENEFGTHLMCSYYWGGLNLSVMKDKISKIKHVAFKHYKPLTFVLASMSQMDQ